MLRKDFQNTVPPIVVCFSGGLDSSALLQMCVDRHGNDKVTAISFDYGQRHVRELTAAMAIGSMLRVRHKIIRLPKDAFRGSSQTDFEIDVPHGHYADESMRVTVVPNRNSLMLNYAAAWAISTNAKTVAYAAHAGDHAVYPDCRPEFAEALSVLFERIHFDPIELFTPFITLSKRDIGEIIKNRPELIRLTYSCYEGKDVHCGLCGTCVERKEALEGFDPTTYAA
jgi:7-cyano-7-deazaguanine synthase